MKVLHIITGLRTGGAEMMLCKLITAQHRVESVAVISLTGRDQLAGQIEACGVPVYALELGGNLAAVSALLRLRQLIKQLQPDLIQSWMYHANLLASLLNSTIAGAAPVIWNIRATPDDLSSEKRLTRWLVRLGGMLSMMPGRILYNSYYSAGEHHKLGYRADRSMTIPNGFECQQFRPDRLARHTFREQLEVAENIWLIGNVARYHPMKDHATFVKAAIRLLEQHYDAHFVMVGNGVEYNNRQLSEPIRQAGFSNRFHLLGERQDLPAIMSALDIYTSSSCASEAFPNVVGEAMASAVPCVVTDVGDSARLVGDTGRVVSPGDPAAIAGCWQSWIEAGREALKTDGEAARARIESEFNLAKIVDQYETLYLTEDRVSREKKGIV